ncbi:MAG TPA: pyridoxamine 5'-phosphate oxidase family protein [Polyangiales bacterium]|nr:pyridoxamine 5'-phosphate oxidase family protein [Polyangiales bacterium]
MSEELAEYIESGVSMLVATRDAALRPHVLRAVGAVIGKDRTTLTTYLNKQVAERALDNLRDNGKIALTCSRPYDHRGWQVKGTMISMRDGDESDRAHQERYLAGFVEHVYIVGLPRSVMRQLRIFPSVAVTFGVEDVFVQTPGPGAGRRLET